jgi:hypothetical protein
MLDENPNAFSCYSIIAEDMMSADTQKRKEGEE